MLLWSSIALAGLYVDAPDARSVVVVLDDGQREHLQLCGDDGGGPDPVPGDGRWACAEPPVEGPVRVGVLIDGTRLVMGEGTLGQDTTLSVDPLQVRAEALTPGSAGAPRPPLPALLLHIDAGALAQAPMVGLSGPAGQDELRCSDDGSFPDRVQNDLIAGCGGVAQGDRLNLSFRLPEGPRDLPLVLPEGAAVIQARFDGDALTLEDGRVLPETRSAPDPQPQPQDGSPSPQPQPGPDGRSGSPLPWALLVGGITGLLGWAWGRRRRHELPPHLAWPQGARLVVETSDLPLREALLQASRHGPVVVLSDAELPAGEPGPILRATSPDVLDVLEALVGLRRKGITALTLVVDRGQQLQAPAELGIDALERIQASGPDGLTVLLLQEPS